MADITAEEHWDKIIEPRRRLLELRLDRNSNLTTSGIS
jgi:hypothetical protein